MTDVGKRYRKATGVTEGLSWTRRVGGREARPSKTVWARKKML